MHGFYNQILKIDLNRQKYTIEPVAEEILARYLGGKGLASHLLMENNPPEVDPLSPENCLIFATGPVSGSRIWGSCRYGAYAKSPQTGLYAESYSGGKVPDAMDSAGYDAIVIQGCSEQPTVLGIHPDGVVFHAAKDLWGKETYETEDLVVERFSRNDEKYGKPGAVVIGPAAENLVCFGVIKNDYWRSAGRAGVGTVMGAKRIKGILFQGDCKRSHHDADGVKQLAKEIAAEFKDHPATNAYKSMGTSQMVNALNNANAFPTKYWSKGHYDRFEEINAPALHTRCEVKPRACLKCFMACGRKTKILNGRHAGMELEGPEYETIFAFGGLCMIDSIEEIAYLNDICDRLGMDTISAGNLCGFAIEASLRQKIDFAIDYGEVDRIAELLKMISKREGIGDVLAQGIKHAAKAWDLEDIAIHNKGMEPPGYDPRVLKGMGLAYMTSDRGACHTRATFYKPELAGMIPPDQIEGKAEMFVEFENRLTIMDTMVFCRFYRDFYQWDKMAEIIHALTGLEVDGESLNDKANDIASLIRRFNLREGLTAEDDSLSKGFYHKLQDSGKGVDQAELDQMLGEYFQIHGWDEQGTPPAA